MNTHTKQYLVEKLNKAEELEKNIKNIEDIFKAMEIMREKKPNFNFQITLNFPDEKMGLTMNEVTMGSQFTTAMIEPIFSTLTALREHYKAEYEEL